MKVYAQYMTKNLRGEVVEALGSDGVMVLDGRHSLPLLIDAARTQFDRLKRIHPDYIGFAIIRGTRFDDANPIIYKWRQQ